MGRIMAIDYGQKRVGIAVTDPLQIIANQLTTVKTHEVFEFLRNYLEKENIDTLVLGYPTQMNNQVSESFSYVKQFETAFKRKYPQIPVVFEDERFTSMIAARAMIEGGMKKKGRKYRRRKNQKLYNVSIMYTSDQTIRDEFKL